MKMLINTAIFSTLALISTVSSATVINEIGDAGNTMPTAQVLLSGTTSILGEIDSNQDTDLYKFSLASASVFTIEVLEISTALDMNLIVFNSLGQGLAGDDDDNNGCSIITSLGGLDSCLTLSLAAGDYFFAVGDNNMGAFESIADFNVSSNFIEDDSGILGSPTTEVLGLVGPEAGPTDFNDVGQYRINFSQATGDTSPVPAPAAIWLVGSGLIGLFGMRKKSAKLSDKYA